jgi:hypothetical protein
MRGTGEWVMLVRDWLAPGCGKAQCLTTLQASIDTNWSVWQARSGCAYADLGQRAHKQLLCRAIRNDDFGIASYHENPTADKNLRYGIQNRWNDLLNYVSPTGQGRTGPKATGCTIKRAQAVWEIFSHLLCDSSRILRTLRPWLWTETTAFKSGVLTAIYNTMLTQFTSRGMWDGFTSADDEAWVTGSGCGYISHNGLRPRWMRDV